MTQGPEFREALVHEATTMAKGMLQHPDEDLVMKDLEPSVVGMQPAALAAARRSMGLARRTESSVATQFVTGTIPKTVASIEHQMPDLFAHLLGEADRSSVARVAGAVSAFVVSTTMAMLLPVFEVASQESPSSEIEDRKILGAIRLYIETADQVASRWEQVQGLIGSRGLETSALNADHLAGSGIREQLQLVLPSDQPFAFIDCRIHRGGEAGGAEALRNSGVYGVLRTEHGDFTTWAKGHQKGRFGSLDAAMDQVRQLAG